MTTEPIREIFRKACKDAGLSYFNPHSFRSTLVRFGEEICQTPAQMKAWSQNMGHANISTTLNSYGTLSTEDQGRQLRSLGEPRHDCPLSPEQLDALNALVKNWQRGR